jgi:predicted transcriptional regulator
MMNDVSGQQRLALIVQIAIGWLNNKNHSITAADLPSLLIRIGAGVNALKPPVTVVYVPAVSVEASLASSEHILSMIDGRPYKGLTRHIGAHGLTPDEYRARYCLPADYPMVSPSYSTKRREAAQKIGLGLHVRRRGRPNQ